MSAQQKINLTEVLTMRKIIIDCNQKKAIDCFVLSVADKSRNNDGTWDKIVERNRKWMCMENVPKWVQDEIEKAAEKWETVYSDMMWTDKKLLEIGVKML